MLYMIVVISAFVLALAGVVFVADDVEVVVIFFAVILAVVVVVAAVVVIVFPGFLLSI